MRYVLEFFTIILPHPTKFCQFFILLIENFNLYSDEDGVKHIRIKARPNKWHENDCPFCHKSCPAYDKHSSRPTTWRGLDWGGILVEVEYQTHRIICLEHGIFEYIETFYNTVRIHSHCDYMSPSNFEKLYERACSLPAA